MSDTPLNNGKATSEFKITAAIIALGVILDAAGVAVAQAKELFPNSEWVGVAMLTIGMLTKIVTALKYISSRTEVKGELIKTARNFGTMEEAMDFLKGKDTKGFARISMLVLMVLALLVPCVAYAHDDVLPSSHEMTAREMPADAPLLSTLASNTLGVTVGGSTLDEPEAQLYDIRGLDTGEPAPGRGCWIEEQSCIAIAERLSRAEDRVSELESKLSAAEARGNLTAWELALAGFLGLVVGGTVVWVATR